ncbi:hypothetical protein E0Z10_g9820 [Xylaria hypoxylon]|uniref:Uncharacterized protein n=1 Tax=Xylaria hypoxylon TaxID=37992 RepID=A0A4Z0Y7M3_9PEZI|nr:hypothetical protein E0Z10_g9820 [Xylaria hypoxylon]
MSRRLETHKIVVLGDGGTGKTALIIQLSLNHFVETYDPTIEDTYLKQTIVDEIPCLLELMDTAGQEEYISLTEEWIKDGEAFVICYSISSRGSFARVKSFFNQVTRIMNPNPDFDTSLVTIVGNKTDKHTEREVSPLEGLTLAQELGCSFVETSAKMAKNVELVFYDLVRMRRQKVINQGYQQLLNQNTPLYKHRRKTFLGSSRIVIPPDEDSTLSGRKRLSASLIKAAQTNNETMVTAVIKCKIDINQQMVNDGSALHSASAAGHVNIVNILIKRGAAVNDRKATGSTPLQLAAAEGHLAVVRLLLHKGALINLTGDSHGTALSAAASRGRTSVVSHLLKKQANVDIVGGPYGTALHAACWNGDTQIVTQLLNAGANIRSRGNKDCTVLQMAAFAGHATVVQLLLDRGARVDIDAPGSKYGSALKAAHDYGNYSAMKALLDAGAATEGLQILMVSDTETARIESNQLEDLDGDVTPARLTPIHNYHTASSSGIGTPGDSSTDLRSKLSPKRPPISDLGFSTVWSPELANIEGILNGLGLIAATLIVTFKGDPLRTGYSIVLLVELWNKMHQILVWGYDTHVVGQFFGASDQQNISQHGNNLLIALQQERKEDPNRPLLFVAHSLGGIVVKVALGNSRGSKHQPQYLSVYESTRGIVFLGTPHGGSHAANWGLVASNVVKFALQEPAERVLRGLKPNNELLENLRKMFLQMLEDGHFGVHSFYETKSMMGIYGINGLVVPYESALVGHAKKEVVAGIHANHSEICKFRDSYDHGYKAVSGAMQDYIKACNTS